MWGSAKRVTVALAAIGLCGVATSVVGAVAAVAVAHQSPTAFTLAQAEAGATEYAENCAGCHADNLAGKVDGPSLKGTGFMSSWGARPTKDLYQYISTAMPPDNAGTLSADAFADIVAYILAYNGAKPGNVPFKSGTFIKVSAIATGETPAHLPQPASDQPMAGTRSKPSSRHGLTVAGTVENYVPVTQAMLIHPPDGDWLMYRRNYQGWSYSPLSQIDTSNVKELRLEWAWTMNQGGANETTPIVHGGIIFLANTGNIVQALDARTGELIWENRIGPDATVAYYGNRSLALYADRVFIATSDAYLYALDARTGKIVWKVEIAPPPKGETGGVMVIRGKVLVGMMDCDSYSTVNCHISAYDAETGKRDWVFYTTALQGTPGGDTWNGLPNTQRAGTDTWIAGTYDPELNTTYWGVAQAKPWMRASRKTGAAAVLYSGSTLALDPDTGKLKWYFQHVPGESLDLDTVFERVLIDHGPQKTLLTIGKDGILWELDRESGKFLAEEQTLFQNVFSNVDPETGEVTYRHDIIDQKTGEWIASCPGPEGGHNWQATSYDAPNDLLIIPLSQSCVLMNGHEADMGLGGGGVSASEKFYFMPGTHRNMGKLVAYRAADMKKIWSFQQSSPFLTAVLTTGGGLAFVGDFNRRFKAVDVKTGKILWQTRLGNTVQGYPVSFSLDGRQFIAITTGLGGGSPEEKPTDLLREVHRPSTGQELYVFALPETH
jgi:alcohol dehydrogenase (cytochrome c)